MFISATTRFPDILGTDWQCKAEPPFGVKECPNYDYPGPELDNSTGEWICRKCFRVIGNQNSTDDEIHSDDAIDDENAEEVEIAYVTEGEKNIDQTPRQKQEIRIRRVIEGVIVQIDPVDQDFAVSLTKNQFEIINMILSLADDDIPLFKGGKNYKPRVIAVNSYFIRRLPNTKAMLAMKIKPKQVISRKTILDNMYRTDVDNPIHRSIDDIGKQLGILSTIIALAIEEHGRLKPTNKEPKPLAQAAAWLYIQCKKNKYKITKKEFYKIPNLSRDAMNRAIESYRDLPQS